MSIFADKPTLIGSLVTLRAFTPDDIKAMGRILADPEVLRLTGSVTTTAETLGRSPELDARTLEWYETRVAQRDRLDLAIVDNGTGGCVGEVVLNEYDAANAACNFRILIGPRGRDRGLGTEATRLVLDYAFSHTTLFRIGLDVFDMNPRAARAYEKAGFVVEGRRRGAFVFDGDRFDAILMSILRSEYVTHDQRQGE